MIRGVVASIILNFSRILLFKLKGSGRGVGGGGGGGGGSGIGNGYERDGAKGAASRRSTRCTL